MAMDNAGPTRPEQGRRTLLLAAAALVGGAWPRVGTAQETPAPAAEPPAAPPPRRRRRRAATHRADPPPPAREEALAPPPRLEPAPVPNRNLEPPRSRAPSDSASLEPSIIHRPLPNTGAARDGARNYDEERLFFPAPGARLTVPFSY